MPLHATYITLVTLFCYTRIMNETNDTAALQLTPVDLKGKKVLIVEDEAPLRKALVDIFTLEGFSVLSAENGQLGLDLALKEKPDVILLDIIMPIMDGLTMLSHLREDKEYGAGASVVMLSNLGMFNEQVSRGVNIVAPAFYLVKTNWAITDVVKKVQLLLLNLEQRKRALEQKEAADRTDGSEAMVANVILP